MACLRRCFRNSVQSAPLLNIRNIRNNQELAGSRFSRRDFVKGALALGALTLPGCKSNSKTKNAPRIAIIGAGIAGLSAAHALAKSGVASEIYEAGARAGGRILTLDNIVAPGTYTEAGGEFIDTDHADMMALAREFGLEIKDALGGEYSGLTENAWFFGGRLRSEADVAAAVREFTTEIQVDMGGFPETIQAGTGGKTAELDAMSLEEYLGKRGVTGWLRDLIIAAYVSEFGLDAGKQSCLNLLTLVSLDTAGGRFAVFGDSDERFRIQGGNQALTDAMAKRYLDSLHPGHRLEAVYPNGNGFKLAFRTQNGTLETKADAVILALPFTLLRSVEFHLELPAIKRKAITELGYGTNSKLFVGYSSRPWRKAGFAGNFFSEGLLQGGWEHTKIQPGVAGGLTLFQGGSAGLRMGESGPAAQAAGMADALEGVFPGTKSARNGNVGIFHWPTYPLSLGSYACYMPGQWTGIAGEERKPVGNLFFAGEHCSRDFQGYMNGGAETGREAAKALLSKWRDAPKA